MAVRTFLGLLHGYKERWSPCHVLDEWTDGANWYRIGHNPSWYTRIGCELFVDVRSSKTQQTPDVVRVFPFARVPDLYRYAKKYARDAYERVWPISWEDYRGTPYDPAWQLPRWFRLVTWYFTNTRMLKFERGFGMNNIMRRMTAAEEYSLRREHMRLYRALDKHLETLEGSPEYADHVRNRPWYSATDWSEPDILIRDAVVSLNRLPGVQTKWTCQGIRGAMHVDWWPGTIWMPNAHQELAYVEFATIPDRTGECLAGVLKETGTGEWAAPRDGSPSKLNAVSRSPIHNEAFVKTVLTFSENA